MLFGFRGVKPLQAILAVAAALLGVGCVAMIASARDSKPMLIPAVIMGLGFLWLFASVLRLPTSFVAVGDERTRIRLGGFADVNVPNSQIVNARMANHSLMGGLGVRSNLRGMVALVTAPGPIAELELRSPVRFWLIPKVWPTRATRVRVSVRHPEKLVSRFASTAPDQKPAKRRR